MATECSLAQILVQTASIVVGWIVVHKLSTARELDKARREMLAKATDSLSSDVTNILGSALKYHTTPRNTEVEQSLKMTLQDISGRVGLLSEVSNNVAEIRQCRAAIVSLKKSVTGSHFEDEHDTPMAEGTQQIQAIAADALRLRQCFQKLKQRQLPSQ